MKKKIWFMILGIFIGIVLTICVIAFLVYQRWNEIYYDENTIMIKELIDNDDDEKSDTLYLPTYEERFLENK